MPLVLDVQNIKWGVERQDRMGWRVLTPLPEATGSKLGPNLAKRHWSWCYPNHMCIKLTWAKKHDLLNEEMRCTTYCMIAGCTKGRLVYFSNLVKSPRVHIKIITTQALGVFYTQPVKKIVDNVSGLTRDVCNILWDVTVRKILVQRFPKNKIHKASQSQWSLPDRSAAKPDGSCAEVTNGGGGATQNGFCPCPLVWNWSLTVISGVRCILWSLESLLWM